MMMIVVELSELYNGELLHQMAALLLCTLQESCRFVGSADGYSA